MVTPYRLVTSKGGHFHVIAHSLHLLASKVLLEKRKSISNNVIQIQATIFHVKDLLSTGKKGYLNS